MFRHRSIIAATDFSENAQQAVERAAKLAKEWGASLTLIHVFNDSVWSSISGIYDINRWEAFDPVQSAQKRLVEICAQLKHDFGITADTQILHGRASKEIQKIVISRDAGLVVVGKHGENWIRDAIVGGTALKLLESAHTPILLVKGRAIGHYQNIAIATDFSANARRASLMALEMFPDAWHHLIHAYHVPFESSMRMTRVKEERIQQYREQEYLRAVRNLEAFATDGKHLPAEKLSKLVLFGSPSSVIFEQVQNLKIDLIAIGKHGGGNAEQLLLGSVTQNVLYHSDCDVLISP
ncbi:MAG: universal stress protein [Nitrosomonadales bacterium]|nr:universal stress protein [Nitrosomonadales bacterium]